MKTWPIWSDIDNKLRIDKTGDIIVRKDWEALEGAIENILLTRVGERVMRPDFGSFLEKYLYEPLSEVTGHLIAMEVLRALKQEDRIVVDKVDVEVNYKLGGYVVSILARDRYTGTERKIVKVLLKE